MANVVLSDAEKTFILHGVEENFRTDGRAWCDYRDIELETGVVSNASGSARLRLANTDVVVGIKTEISCPNAATPEYGKLDFFVDCSANATPQFEGRGGEDLANELVQTLNAAYEAADTFDLTCLCILRGQSCWKLFVDILVIAECGGNLYDAVSLAVKAALYNTKLPRVTAELMDAGEAELVLSDDPFDYTRIPIDEIPILITVSKVGDQCIVDPTAEEEQCSKANVVISISKQEDEYYVSSMHTSGKGALQMQTLSNSLGLSLTLADTLNNALLFALRAEDETRAAKRCTEVAGFLK